MQLASRFASRSPVIRSRVPLTDEQLADVVPSIFAEEKHDSRSDRYIYIPTINILQRLRTEGFQPFFACQTRVKDEGKREHAKHMIRLRHASQINGREANEIVLLNSHDGSSTYQMLAGVFRFVCSNGMVCGDTINDVRVPHKGDVVGHVIDGAYTVLDEFDMVAQQVETMRAINLTPDAQRAFADSALMLKYESAEAAPIQSDKLLDPRRIEDRAGDLWTTFNRVQENLVRGGIHGRTTNGRRTRTREVAGIDGNVALNRALWTLAEKMRDYVK